MRTWFQRLTDVASVAATDEMLRGALPALVQDLGFDGYAYLYVEPVRMHAVSNYAQEWQDRYFAVGYREVDPVVRTASTTMRAFSWSAPALRECETKELKRFYSEASDFGIKIRHQHSGSNVRPTYVDVNARFQQANAFAG